MKSIPKKIRHISRSSRGFTLIETFVAITILVSAVLGPMTLLSRALQSSRYIKDEITATFLAQEGVELMIDKRNDINLVNINSCLPSLKERSLVEKNLYLNETNGYVCDDHSGTASIFTRKIEVAEIVVGSQYKITSTVTFVDGVYKSRPIVSSSIIFK